MIYSLNEIDAHCKKAARGCGFEWGYAEEFGKIARWLAAYNLPGVSVIAHYLIQKHSSAEEFSKPIAINQFEFKAANNSSLCPIKLGSFLSDTAQINENTVLKFNNLAYPILLLPYLAQLTSDFNQTIIYRYEQVEVQFSNGQLNLTDTDTLTCEQTSIASCTFDSEKIVGKPAAVVGQNVDQAIWNHLKKFAEKTYVPASEASRKGAGPAD